MENNNNLSTNVVGEGVMEDVAHGLENINSSGELRNYIANLNLTNSLVTAAGVAVGMDTLKHLIKEDINEDKQDKLYDGHNHPMQSTVFNDGSLGNVLMEMNVEEYNIMKEDLAAVMSNGDNLDLHRNLISAGATLDLIRGAGGIVQLNVDSVQTELNNKRVEVYTNWDDDTDKTEVAFVTASGNN